MKNCLALLSFILLAAPALVRATPTDTPCAPVAGDRSDTPEKFEIAATCVRKNMERGGRYELIASSARADANADLDTIAALLRKGGSIAGLSVNDKLRLFNTTEHLNGILTHSDSERLVCELQPRTGTTVPIKVCKTVGELWHDDHWKQTAGNSMKLQGTQPPGLGFNMVMPAGH